MLLNSPFIPGQVVLNFQCARHTLYLFFDMERGVLLALLVYRVPANRTYIILKFRTANFHCNPFICSISINYIK